jgi:uncharacterized protein (DUF2141 family)
MNLLLVLFYLFVGQAEQAGGFNLTLKLTGIEPHQGNLTVSVYNDEKVFLIVGEEYRTKVIKAVESEETVVFKGLPEGVYAVAIYQDSNANGKMDKSFLGIPKEIYGFSNNFRPMFSKPGFDDCKFELDGNKTLNIELK